MYAAIIRCCLLSPLLVGLFIDTTAAQDHTITLGESGLLLTAPAGWERKQPSSRIVEYEYAVAPAAGDEIPGRLTVMGAGGSVEANVERWVGQFSQPDGSRRKPRSTSGPLPVGKYRSLISQGPIRILREVPSLENQAVDRPNFRMLAAIVTTDSAGNYFLKFYGPRETVSANEKAFLAMLDTLTKK